MKKEEFPTFLNEQPKVIFGRTGRELLITVLGAATAYLLWCSINSILFEIWWEILCLILCGLLAIAFAIFAMISVGGRPLEIWFAAWLTYVLTPKLFLYQQLDEEVEGMDQQQEEIRNQQQRPEQVIFEQP